ncbi:MAG: hypothetical protein HGB28_00740 [Oscillochloris sp.]|nr:hypothetical protein [Oscillochloris sp.]
MLSSSPQSLSATPAASQPTSAITISPPSFGEEQAWTLSAIAIDRPGLVRPLADGMSITYALHGAIQATGSASVKEGTFDLIVSAFQPSHDMPGQQAGRWYIRGDWSITDAQAAPPVRGQRHRQGVMAGTLVSEVDENPFAAPQSVALPLHLPMTLTEAGWVQGKGTLTLADTGDSGSITLVVNRRGAAIRAPGTEP